MDGDGEPAASAQMGSSERHSAPAGATTSKGEQAMEELSPLSLAAAFPSGQLGLSLSRIRSTINSYTGKIAEMSWSPTFKLNTVKALLRRWRAHEDAVTNGMNLDLISCSGAQAKITPRQSGVGLGVGWGAVGRVGVG